ncbi:hypothetical protein AB0A63_35305 [Lentzea sp. NPDC042327]|uniref:McrC family protein n=1 Tax=Lentzea sp. NPDC042327 TaxID=3154801 RepID=UPI0033FB8B51
MNKFREQHTTLLDFELTEADLRKFDGPELRKYFTPRPTAKGTTLTVRKVVGLLKLDNADLVIEPKVPVSGEMLLHWLHYAANRDHPVLSQRRGWDADGDYFPDMAVEALLDECRTLLRDQLRKDYQPRQTVEAAVRGRLDLTRQATHRFGMLDRLHVRTFDRTVQIWENEVCGAALRHAAKTATTAKLRQQARQLSTEFPLCTAEVARSTLARSRHNRLNLRYRAAHAWAEVVLRAGGVSELFLPRTLVGESHLLVIEKVWERVVHRMVGSPATIEGVMVHRYGDRARPYRPDALAERLPVDAKWKDYDRRAVTREDVHQLLTYAHAYQPHDPRAVIVHPSTAPTAKRTIDVKHLGRRIAAIDVIGVDVSTRPEENSATLQGLLHR